jgi:predicted nucleic acid-binding protein
MPAGHPRVFDSWALLALLQNRPAAQAVRSLITKAHASHTPLWISLVNLGEVWYLVARRHSADLADEKIREIRGLGFTVQELDWPLTRHAVQLKAQYALSYADCFAAALAKQRDVELVTGDPEFKRLEQEIKIHWL